MKATIESLDLYPVELVKADKSADAEWIACIPILGRMFFRGYGDSPEEAIADLRAFASEKFAEYACQGKELPDPPELFPDYSGKLLLRLPRHLHQEIAEEAQENGVSLNTYLISILSDRTLRPSFRKVLQTLCDDVSAARRKLDSVGTWQANHEVRYHNYHLSDSSFPNAYLRSA